MWNLFFCFFFQGNRFEGCLKRFSVVFNSNETILLENSTQQRFSKCLEFFPPVQTFGDSNYFSVPISHRSNRKVSIFFRFQTFLSDGVLLYAFSRNSSVDEFFSFDLIDGFMSVTVHFRSLNKRQELFQQRFNDGQTHSIRIQIEHFDGKIRFDVSVDQRQNNKVAFRTQIDNFEVKPGKVSFSRLQKFFITTMTLHFISLYEYHLLGMLTNPTGKRFCIEIHREFFERLFLALRYSRFRISKLTGEDSILEWCRRIFLQKSIRLTCFSSLVWICAFNLNTRKMSFISLLY